MAPSSKLTPLVLELKSIGNIPSERQEPESTQPGNQTVLPSCPGVEAEHGG